MWQSFGMRPETSSATDYYTKLVILRAESEQERKKRESQKK